MASWNGILTNKRSEGGFENVSFNLVAGDWIRAVANDNALAIFARCDHAIRHRVDKGINAAADVLHVEHEDINISQHRFRRYSSFTVQGIDRQAGCSVDRVFGLAHVVLNIATY